jgi:hypothetical protein
MYKFLRLLAATACIGVETEWSHVRMLLHEISKAEAKLKEVDPSTKSEIQTVDSSVVAETESVVDPYVAAETKSVVDPYVAAETKSVVDPYVAAETKSVVDPYVAAETKSVVDSSAAIKAESLQPPAVADAEFVDSSAAAASKSLDLSSELDTCEANDQ